MSRLSKKMMQTPDLNNERLNTLKQLYPDLFTVEGKLNCDELKKIIDPDLVRETERFEFKWFGKSEAKRNAFTPSMATLLYEKERSVNPEYADGNIIIEGENLETLKCLLPAYRERVKCIYIDPPYNTGKDFVYSDNWDESKQDYWQHIGVVNGDGIKLETNPEGSGRFHSNWMNMLYTRLLLARQLLRNDGVIFISIDDNEVHHLRKMCDEVFGEENLTGSLVWKKKYTGGKHTKGYVDLHEYILVYAKDRTSISNINIDRPDDEKDKFIEEDEFVNERGRFYVRPLKSNLAHRPTLVYPLTAPDGTVVKTQWLVSKETFDKLLLEKRVEWRKKQDGTYQIYRKYYEYDSNGTVKPPSLIDKYPNTEAKTEIKNLFNITEGRDNIFYTVKPTNLIKHLLEPHQGKNDIVLDFFAGSGTTAHAVIELNKQDGGNRKYILVQLPEVANERSEAYKAGYKKISDITIERNKRVIEKLEEETQNQLSLRHKKQPSKLGFKVYKLGKSKFPRVEFTPDPSKTEEENIALLDQYIREKEATFDIIFNKSDIFDEVLLKNGFMLNYTKEKVDDFSRNEVYRVKDDFKECLVCIEMKLEDETMKALKGFKDTIFICLEKALDTTAKWNLKQLFGDKLIAF